MANRFLETNFYKSPFVRSLKGALKGLYSFIICDCTHAGIWSFDLEAASMYIGFDVKMHEFDEFFIKTSKAIEISKGKYFFPDFIEHQYPSGLQADNKAHKYIISELKKYDFLEEKQEGKKIIYFLKNKGAWKGLGSIPCYGYGYGLGNGNGNEGVLGETKNKNLLCPKMLSIFTEKIKAYPADKKMDYSHLLSIAEFLHRTGNMQGTFLDNTQEILKIWESISEWIKSDNFYCQKSLKTISNHIQEILNKTKNGNKQITGNGVDEEAGSVSRKRIEALRNY